MSETTEQEIQEDDSLRGMFRELTKRSGKFDVTANIQKQFADVIASNEKWRKRIESPRRDWDAEAKEDKYAVDKYNSPDIEVIYWQTPRFPRLAAVGEIVGLFLYNFRHSHSKTYEKIWEAMARLHGDRNAKLHKKLVHSIGEDWRLGLTWKVSAETTFGPFGKVTVSEGFSGWSIALNQGKFPGRNIPRIAFARIEQDWRETPERLEKRLGRAKVGQTQEPKPPA